MEIKLHQIRSTRMRHSVRQIVIAGLLFCTTLLAFIVSTPIKADGGVTFTRLSDPVVDAYERTPSDRHQGFQFFKNNPSGPFTQREVIGMPMKSRGAPGVCILDYDNDGDLDIYATNGPGSANSLYSNQFVETGNIGFIDRAGVAGAAATSQDSSGCVFGDIDNDGDHDLYVLGSGGDNRLFENNGNGMFKDITVSSGTGGDGRWAVSASMGDVNNDGLLDIYVGNLFDMNNRLPIFMVPADLNEHNQLFLNMGNNQFTNISNTSGVETLNGMLILKDGEPVPIKGSPAGISWAVSMVDIDLDGDIDIFEADDQAALQGINETPANINVDRGMVHIFKNDGSGQFVDTYQSAVGSWMGLAFADFNSDGTMDYFGSNFGDVGAALIFANVLGAPPELALGAETSRWFFGNGDGTFIDAIDLGVPPPRLPGIISSPFGWGTSAFDYDNDADTDIVYVGGIQGPFIIIDNPLAVLQNDGNGYFSRDSTVLNTANNKRHLLAAEHGMATGDLNNDGFVDIVSIASFRIPDPLPPPPTVFPNPFRDLFGGPFDSEALIGPVFAPAENSGEFVFLPSFLDFPNGKLSIDLNSGGNGNNWVAVDVIGTIGITANGNVNRDGIGAVVQFTPEHGGKTVMNPILGGSSYASQHSLTARFGLGDKYKGDVDVLWPGGIRNRYIKAKGGERIVFPEIPCDPAGDWSDKDAYKQCVKETLDELINAGVINHENRSNFKTGMKELYKEINN